MLNKYEYLCFSSHKTSSQSLLSIFHANNIQVCHIHTLGNIPITFHDLKLNICNDKYIGWGEKQMYDKYKLIMLNNIDIYTKINKKKLKIISIIRDPRERLISSFFQSYHTDEISYLQSKQTTVDKLNNHELYNLYCNNIINDTLPGKTESIDDMSFLFDTDIINNLQNKGNYYYYENKFIELYVMKFTELIKSTNLDYINNILQINLIKNSQVNLSKDKSYYNKYKLVKQLISDEINFIILQKYNNFYFDE